MHNELDRLAENAFAREKGFAEGKAKGKAEGEAKGRAEGRAEGEVKRSVAIAKAMLADKMDPALIAKYTGLSEEKVRSLL